MVKLSGSDSLHRVKMKRKIWFITGISSGLGKAIAQAALEKGDFVLGTFRKPDQVEKFNKCYEGRGHAFQLDVTEFDKIDAIADFVFERFGCLDVLVNNAGYGLAGAIEETSINETRALFEANFFGTLKITQAFLPLFRKQKSGHIFQISSHAGFKAFPGFGIYNASKFAVEGFSEALAAEVAPLGIKVTIVEPGPFRTQFAGASFQTAAATIDDYQHTSGAFRLRIKEVDGRQEGNPDKAAQAILTIANLESPPLRLPLGKIALNSISTKLESVKQEVEKYWKLAENTVF